MGIDQPLNDKPFAQLQPAVALSRLDVYDLGLHTKVLQLLLLLRFL